MKNREIIVYPKNIYGFRSKEEKWGVKKLSESQRQRRPLLFLGTGRCGTTYTARLMKHIGLDVGHEIVGKHGTVSHYFCVDSEWHPMSPSRCNKTVMRNHVGERRSDFIFDSVFHIVRHPLTCIPSMAKMFNGVIHEYWLENLLIPKDIPTTLLRCAYAWRNINRLCEQQSNFTFQMERYEDNWDELMEILALLTTHFNDGPPKFPRLPAANRSSGFRKSEPLKWSQLYDISPELTREIKAMAKAYGYED